MPPLTMLDPSGENCTEEIEPNAPPEVCAFCFSALSSRDAVPGVGALSFGIGEHLGVLGHLHPTL